MRCVAWVNTWCPVRITCFIKLWRSTWYEIITADISAWSFLQLANWFSVKFFLLILASQSFLLSLESFSDLSSLSITFGSQKKPSFEFAILLTEQPATPHDVTILSATLLWCYRWIYLLIMATYKHYVIIPCLQGTVYTVTR